MKTFLPVLLTLVLQALVTALAALLNIETVRPEPAFAVIAYTAVRLDPLAGALAASAVGLTTDLMSLSPLGLHMLTLTLLYLLARLAAELFGVARAPTAVPFVLALSLTGRVILGLLLLLFAESSGRLNVWPSHLISVLLDGLITIPVWLLLEQMYARIAVNPERRRP